MADLARMFYAYASRPPDVAETIESAIAELVQGGLIDIQGWKSIPGTGRFLIEEIAGQIDSAQLFGADLSTLNNNVLFELGYAIGKQKRIWISSNDIHDPDRRSLRRLEILLPVGQARYVNKVQLIAKFYDDQPWGSPSPLISFTDGIRAPLRRKGASLFYLKSPTPTDSSIVLSQELESSRLFGERVIDDPNEVFTQSLEWYVQKIRRADAVVTHMLPNTNTVGESHNAKCALVAGIAFALDKPLCMLAHAPYETPLDYQHLLSIHSTANQCKSLIRSWISENEERIITTYDQIHTYRNPNVIGNPLALLSVGEIVAEHEDLLIDEYFLDTAAYQHALEGRQAIFVGRKGTGKSANFYAISNELSKDPRNHVCIIKPVSYELNGIVTLLKQTIDKSEQGYLLESLWKFLVLTELAQSVYTELKRRPVHHQLTQGEEALVSIVDRYSDLISPSFAIRLQSAVEQLIELEQLQSSANTRARISELLHSNILSQLRSVLGASLQDRERIAILVDNLDTGWGERDETELLANFLFGLLDVAASIPRDFQHSNSRNPTANVTLAVFLRSDIFSVIQDVAREPDKIAYERITWDDPALMMRVVDNRLVYSLDEQVTSESIWSQYFPAEMYGIPIRHYIGQYVIPRPRDAIYFVREVLSQAMNRGHQKVEEDDIVRAATEYSQYAFNALVVEDDPRIGKLEAILYEFAGSHSDVTLDEVFVAFDRAGIADKNRTRYLELLLDTNFLGIPKRDGGYEFPADESKRKISHRVARQIAMRSNQPERFRINRVFWQVLEISA